MKRNQLSIILPVNRSVSPQPSTVDLSGGSISPSVTPHYNLTPHTIAKSTSVALLHPPPSDDGVAVEWEDEEWNEGGLLNRFGSYRRSLPQRHYSPFRRKSSNLCAIVIQSSPLNETMASYLNSNRDSVVRAAQQSQNHQRDSATHSGETLIHLAARLGHEHIVRILMNETSYACSLTNSKGQTPLLCAIEAGYSSTATLLMENDSNSLTIKDNLGSSVFHYVCEQCNDIVLSRAIALLKRLHISNNRLMALERLVEKNFSGKTSFVIAIEKGSLKCVRYILTSKWLQQNVAISEFMNDQSLKTAIDYDQLDIVACFVSDMQCFSSILNILITPFDNPDQHMNVLEYSIYLRKPNFVRLFISVRISPEHHILQSLYKNFLRHYDNANQTPLQRMLTIKELVPFVPLLLEQFVSDEGADLSIVDDCLHARPSAQRCIFGRSSDDPPELWSSTNWLKHHPLTLIAEADHKPVYDHYLVKMCVDLKFQLFGNFLYFIISCSQVIYVTLYTGITLGSPTPALQGMNYYSLVNYTCEQTCWMLTNDMETPLQPSTPLRALRFMLLILSCLTLLKEFIQLFTQKEKYFRKFFINMLEVHMYVSAIIYTIDLNECTRRTGLRCREQWETGAVGLLSVWTSLLLVLMNGIKFGKHGLLFITVLLTFLKFIAFYIFIWIGYILSCYMLLKDIMPQFHFFNFVPKLLSMFIGEYNVDATFFNNNVFMRGSEGALIVYSAFMFTMFIVMANIMGGLAVADVKQFRQNAKREHLRARIETILSLQAKLGILCEIFSKIILKLSKHSTPITFSGNNESKGQSLLGFKYHLWKLELCTYDVKINDKETVTCEVGYYRHRSKMEKMYNETLFEENDHQKWLKKTDELKECLEDSTLRTHNELRKLTVELQTDFEDIKRRLFVI
ncbi:unnamed protein product [Didymodactylos carnosus]|uniref:Uncharacterized protein n=1 Tax=Didymodactylos carnosus TaxID=1234261 RepID=A0A814RBS0_9BILA|nr:unnamed protein product [Didymodactylos carnosus]CAF1130055.1 unnamed protein product [Didymodactylos carnosus]CAF3763035.1 unnamed protein product [Didymodactylos carnosus]CAF3893776.1 unnamed protein product [Didymodactylos carnosus]